MKTCIVCNTDFKRKPNTSGKYCSLLCANRNRKGLIRNKYETLYLKNPIKCKSCSTFLTYDQKLAGNKFCSSSCGATNSNLGRDPEIYVKQALTLKSTLSKKTYSIKEGSICKIDYCVICGAVIKRINGMVYKSCNKECKSKLLSLANRGKTGGSTKQYIQIPESSGRVISLDSSWELLVANDLNANNIVWSRPNSFMLSDGRRYTPDFYLPDYNLYLDPKAYRKGYQLQVEKIQQFEKEHGVKCLVISDKSLLTWSHIQNFITSFNDAKGNV